MIQSYSFMILYDTAYIVGTKSVIWYQHQKNKEYIFCVFSGVCLYSVYIEATD